MILFIIPGGGDPENGEYKKGFELIRSEAEKRNFSEINIFKFPGHFSFTRDKGYLNQKVASGIVLQGLSKAEERKQEYAIFSRSFGCGITLELLLKYDFSHLKRVVLWGPAPIISIYTAAVYDTNGIEKAKKDKGCYLNFETYKTCTPLEIQLLEYQGKHNIYIGAGSEDIYCKPIFFDFLKQYIGKENLKRKCILLNPHIKGLKHEVTEYNEEYIDLIFGS